MPDGPDLGEEARTLLDAVHEWARRTLPGPTPEHAADAPCQWCPLCQFASVLRGEHPELAERLTEAGNALVAAARALVDTATDKAPGPARRRPRPRPTPRVEAADVTKPPR